MADTDSKPDSKVLFRVPTEDGGADVETLWATSLGGERYRLENSPFYAYGVSWEDVVLAPFDSDEGFPTFKSVVAKSGNRTVRIVFDLAIEDGNASGAIVRTLNDMGCSYEGANKRYISLNVPKEVELQTVLQFLVEQDCKWEYADPTYAG